jgi:hypothetical protein
VKPKSYLHEAPTLRVDTEEGHTSAELILARRQGYRSAIVGPVVRKIAREAFHRGYRRGAIVFYLLGLSGYVAGAFFLKALWVLDLRAQLLPWR